MHRDLLARCPVWAFLLPLALSVPHPLRAGPGLTPQPAAITVHLDKPLGAIDPRIFGHFTEEVLTSYEGGIASELLYNRKFEMPEELPASDLPTPLVIGTASGWEPLAVDTSVALALDQQV